MQLLHVRQTSSPPLLLLSVAHAWLAGVSGLGAPPPQERELEISVKRINIAERRKRASKQHA